MTGENADTRAPQPGGRKPAPGALAIVQAFTNTHYDLAGEHAGEVLLDAEALREWLAGRGLLDAGACLGDDDLERALAVREGLRALALANNDQHLDARRLDAMRRASAHATSEVRIEPAGPQLIVAPDAGIDVAIGALLAITARAMIDGSWPRVKACPGRRCGWVFYDHSRNQSARWCSMKVCGDREKARAYYQRQVGSEAEAC
jgi:predicted RNA-binding Zn ribbon-like protein